MSADLELDARGRWLRAVLAALTATWHGLRPPLRTPRRASSARRLPLMSKRCTRPSGEGRIVPRICRCASGQVTRLEARHKSLAPVGQECPIEFCFDPLQQRLFEVRQAIRHVRRLRAVQEELAKPAKLWEPDKFRGLSWGASHEETRNLLSAAGERRRRLRARVRLFPFRGVRHPVEHLRRSL